MLRFPILYDVNAAARLGSPVLPRAFMTPNIPLMPGIPYSLSGLFPNRDHNEALLNLTGPSPPRTSPEAVSLFAASPFLSFEEIIGVFSPPHRSIAVNFPSSLQYGAEFSGVLEKSDHGISSEKRFMSRFKNRELPFGVTVTTAGDLAHWADLAPDFFFIAPDFSLLHQSGLNEAQLLKRCLEIGGKTDTPTILMISGTNISRQSAWRHGVTGIVDVT